MNYTAEQQLVINHNINQHALVSAVAGSGKTQTLIARIQFLISKGVSPSKILVLMYNKSAQEEFANRLFKVLEQSIASRVNVRTMHSLGNGFLQAFSKVGKVKYTSILKEYETDNILIQILKKAHKEHKITKEINNERIEEFKGYISVLKSSISSKNKKLSSLPAKDKKILDTVFDLFNKECESKGVITYDDMIYITCKIFEKEISFVKKAQQIYSHIIIDEYQDINEAQQYLLKCLVGNETTVMAVGDVDQTIYQWRGSTPYYMLEGFQKDFKNVKYFELSYTFRYGDLVSLMANNIISNNKSRHKNLCITYPKLKKVTDVSILDDSDKVVAKLKKLIESGVQASEIVVLVRKYNSTTIFELSCLYSDLPYSVVADKNVFDENLFRAIYGYLMLVNNGKGFLEYQENERIEFIKAMLDYPSLYLKKDQKQRIAEEIASNLIMAPQILEGLLSSVIEPYKKKNIIKVADSWKQILKKIKTKNVEKAIASILEILDLKKVIQKNHSETYKSQSKLKIIDGIVAFANSKEVNIQEFLIILKDLYEKSIKKESFNDNSIQIMSIHRAKGLEWNYVVLYDVTEGGFLGDNIDKISESILEEERRLFYVAATRVKKHLFIVAANDIKRLNAWYEVKSNKFPRDLKCSNSLRFLYEGNLLECENFIKQSSFENNKSMFKKYSQKVALVNN
ncbi:ATP-dependent helicase [Francisella frigiditurris]|uniref:DNA 3'-5' helicase n=1 Tax=Francisella frigiditurris TaxID=1542390 RepID=A0A1J0KRJ9_9GAMM|nr:ATP-dependent helicase [Francisella frigiditurris]APC96236.1 hypothetical protein KX01_1407 [Francisella frigiditurris]